MRKHARWQPSPIAIDGWHLRPEKVAQLRPEEVWAGWIVATPSVLEARERSNLDWMAESTDPDRMLENFLARSLWFNEMVRRKASMLRMNILTQTGDVSVDELCDRVLDGL